MQQQFDNTINPQYQPWQQQQPYPPMPPGPPQFQQPPPKAPQAGFATAALVLSITGLILSDVALFGIVPGVLAVVFGIIALRQYSNKQRSGKGMAIWAIVIGVFAFMNGWHSAIDYYRITHPNLPSVSQTQAAPQAGDTANAPVMPPLSQEQEDANEAAKNAPPVPPAEESTGVPSTTTPAPRTTTPLPPAPVTPDYTFEQEQAIGTAQDYLEVDHFSRKSLIDQLVFEGYSKADATFGVDHIDVNWNEQAVQKAQDYLDSQHFSRSGLIEQLRFEGFTKAQATYGVDHVGH
jgi:hypothetical protein